MMCTCKLNNFSSEDYVALMASLRTCSKNRDLIGGVRIHDDILRQGLLSKFLDGLIVMYAKCGALAEANRLLEQQRCKNVFSWNALITAYARHGQGQKAISCFEKMLEEGLPPNATTFACTLKACGSIKALYKGEQIHEVIVRQGLLRDDIVLGNALIDMYVKCGALPKAHCVLTRLPSRDAVSWNSLINGYVQQGLNDEALHCYEQMKHEGLCPDGVTFIVVLKACARLKALDKGEMVHDEIMKQGMLGKDIVLGTALVDMYAKCGALLKARAVFDKLPSQNVITWNALITGYTQGGHGKEALLCYDQMQKEDCAPDVVTFACVLKACGCIGALHKGRQIHKEISRYGNLQNDVMVGTALVEMYSQLDCLEEAQLVFDELNERDVVLWNAMISGYVENGKAEQALECFNQMQKEGLLPSVVTVTCVLKACGIIGAVDKGKQVHDQIVKRDLLQYDLILGSALVDMYANCGFISMAQKTFEGLSSHDITTWNALIAGYAHRGETAKALLCFQQMQDKGLSPNSITFSCLLTAFSHSGLTEEGNTYFMVMDIDFGIKPELEHYTCMVDTYGRAGHLNMAMSLIQQMPFLSSSVWFSLLGACQRSINVIVGRWAYEQAIKLDRNDATAHVLMADVYGTADMFVTCMESIQAAGILSNL
ncbi:hypothetical protein KP509_02G028200 [Ceratopteris richardii]|nr:hypothetical protein KP509_02G028200 [Ceratopteris richardii]